MAVMPGENFKINAITKGFKTRYFQPF